MDKNEVICISSDDDDDNETGQDDSNKKHVSVITKVSKDNCTSDVKMEIDANETVKGETCEQKKRKISEVDNNDNIEPKKSAKVFVSEKENNEASSEEESSESTSKQENEEEKMVKPQLIVKEKKMVKPQLIVKEKKKFSPMAQDTFPMFISLCLQRDRSEDMKTIVNKLKRRYEQLDATYTNSEEFTNFLNEKRNEIMNTKHRLYMYISDVMSEMKNRCIGRSTLLNGRNTASSTKEESKGDVNKPSTAFVNDDADKMDETNNKNEVDQERSCALQKKIRKLERAMQRCKEYIRIYGEAEINFDEENNSNYIKLEKFKYRMVELYNKYCECTGESTDAGRQYLRPKHFSTTGIVVVDHAISSFINAKISKRSKLQKVGSFVSAIIFPDYRDILECITKCNDSHNLGLDTKKIRQLAKKAFVELGEYLQRSRRNDYWDTFSLDLDDKDDDPALKDSELADKLMQNKKEGDKRLATVFETYVKRQEEMKDESIEEDETSSIENGEDDEEEDSLGNSVENILDISENDVNSSMEEDENSADEVDSSKSKPDTNVKPNLEVMLEVIEIEEKCKIDVNDRLKGNDGNNSNSTSTNGVASIPSCKDNSASEAKEKIDATSLPDTHTLPDVIQSTDAVENPKVDKDPITEEKDDVPNGVSEESTESKQLEEEKPPLLRVRSFAKPPTTWEDTQEKADKSNANKSSSGALNNNGVIDLTAETSNDTEIAQRMTIQIGSKILPIKAKYQTVVIPSGKSIINVKNITNNYVRLNPRDADSSNVVKAQRKLYLLPVQPATGVNKGSSIVRIPTVTAANQQTNANAQAKNMQLRQYSNKNLPQKTQQQTFQASRTTLPTKNQKTSTLQPSKSK